MCALVTGVQTCALPICGSSFRDPVKIMTVSVVIGRYAPAGGCQANRRSWREKDGQSPPLCPIGDGLGGIQPEGPRLDPFPAAAIKIGRASCRERVCQYV